MLTKSLHTTSRKLIAIAALCGSTILTDSSASRGDMYEPDGQGRCVFSLQLASDPYARTQYLMLVNEAKRASSSGYGDAEGMYGAIVPATHDSNEKVEIDYFSFDCITCHDGMNAPSHDVRFKNDARNRQVDINSVTGSHPIGMHYESYAYVNRELKNIQQLDPAMIFVNGKVGCLSCHNPLNPARKHLVMSNRGSNLCFSCHSK